MTSIFFFENGYHTATLALISSTEEVWKWMGNEPRVLSRCCQSSCSAPCCLLRSVTSTGRSFFFWQKKKEMLWMWKFSLPCLTSSCNFCFMYPLCRLFFPSQTPSECSQLRTALTPSPRLEFGLLSYRKITFSSRSENSLLVGI